MLSLLLLLFSIGNCIALNVYVSQTNGNDENSGLDSLNAFKTLHRAQSAVRTFIKYNSSNTNNVIVYIDKGIYEESLYFTNADSGNEDGYIQWRSYPNIDPRSVTISGGQQIDISSFYSCKSPFNSNIELLCANLSSLNINDIGSMLTGGLIDCQHNKLELFYNNNPQTLARWPNINYNTKLYQYTTITKVINETTFMYNNGNNNNNIKYWNQEIDPWMHGYWSTDWFDTYTQIDDIEYDNRDYVITSKHNPNFNPLTNSRFYAVNMLSEIDTETEYYVDKNRRILYWYPPQKKENLINNIVVSIKEYVVTLSKTASNLAFQDISISYSRITGIYTEGGKDTNWNQRVQNINISNCNIDNHGNNGVDINGMDLKVTNNNVKYIGCKGISVVGGDYFTLKSANNLVKNNTIYNYGKWKRSYMPGLFWAGVGNTYSYNNITFGPHNSILGGGNEAYGNLGGCNNIFEYNYISNTTFEVSDSGSFYTCGQNEQGWINRGNVIRYNTFQNIRNLVPLTTPSGDAAPIQGIYLDDQQSGWNVYNNTFINCKGGMLIGGGRRNKLRNNYCYDVDYCVHVDNRGMTWQQPPCTPPKGSLWEGLYSVNYQQPPWSTSYPEIVNIPEPCVPVFADIENNEYCGQNTKFAQCCQNLVCGDCTEKELAGWNDTATNNIYKCH